MKILRSAFFVLIISLFIELGFRFLGFGDFPIYQIDSSIGYIPAPNQSGKFLRKNEWVFNDKSMGVEERFQESEKVDILVIGDSLVYGGNPYRQEEKLGAQLQRKLGETYKVWPVGAPSWSFLNEKEYLDRHPEVLAEVEGIVWIFNSGDFQDRSQWWTDATHPRARPWSVTYYLLNKYYLEGYLKYLFPNLLFWIQAPEAVSRNPLDQEIGDFNLEIEQLSRHHWKKRLVVFYPNKIEELHAPDDFYESLAEKLEEQVKVRGWRFLDLRKSVEWKERYYRDGIHPTGEGYEKFSKEIAEVLEK